MNKISQSEKGFTAVEALLIILILAVISFGGYYVWHTQHTTTNTSATTSTAASNPYVGWKFYTLKQEKLTFRYPSTWTLKNNSDSNNDFEILTGTHNFQMTIGAGADVSAVGFPYGGSRVVQADPVTFAGHPGYIDLWTDEGTTSGSIYSMWLSQSNTQAGDFFPSKNIKENVSNSSFVALMDYQAPSSTSFTNESLSYVENDVNYKDAKLVIDSMSY
jgi:Tfp pilus assembly protein PilE